MNSARRSDAPKCALPSLRSLRIASPRRYVAKFAAPCSSFRKASASKPAAPFLLGKIRSFGLLLVPAELSHPSLIFPAQGRLAPLFLLLQAGRFCLLRTRFCPSRKSKIFARGPRSHFCNAVRSLRSSLSSHSLQISSSRTACAVYLLGRGALSFYATKCGAM